MRASFGLPSIESESIDGKPPIEVKYEIPYFTTSGIQVRYLKIIEKSGYLALPWVRYITQSGDYQIRTKWNFQVTHCEIKSRVLTKGETTVLFITVKNAWILRRKIQMYFILWIINIRVSTIP